MEPYPAHCDDADFLDLPGYPQSREQATAVLLECRTYLLDRFWAGITKSAMLIHKNKKGKESIRDIDTFLSLTYLAQQCTFVPRGSLRGRAKCVAFDGLGRALHVAQDFYSHSNWADGADANRAFGIQNPPGLGGTELADVMNTRLAFDPPAACANRIRHADLNKDNGTIDPRSGTATAAETPRGEVGSNFSAAVSMAIEETKRLWRDFRTTLIEKHGRRRGNLMICAFTRDKPVHRKGSPVRARPLDGLGRRLLRQRDDRSILVDNLSLYPARVVPLPFVVDRFGVVLSEALPGRAQTEQLGASQDY